MTNYEFDFFSKEFIEDPYPAYDKLRSEVPIFYSEEWQLWFFTRYRDVHSLLRDRRVGRQILHVATREELGWPEQSEIYEPFNKFHYNTLMETEPPVHTRLRALVHKAFTLRQIETMGNFIATFSNSLIDGFEAKGDIDFMKEYAEPIPVAVICALLGIPFEMRDQLIAWSHQIVKVYELNHSDEDVITAGKAVQDFSSYIKRIADERRVNPADDLISHLAHVEEEGEKLNADELVATCILLLNAGHEATINAFGNGLLALLQHPDQLIKLVANPALWGSAVDEILRYDTPLHFFTRWVLEDMEYEGLELKKGTQLGLIFAAANRDAERFPDPHTFDVERQDNQHISFGQGTHYCLGAPLAKLELATAFRILFERLPNLELAEARLEHRDSFIFHGLKSLNVKF
jgi:unspecific monooxygenase